MDVTVEPHYLIENKNPIQEELLAISQKFPIYGIGDGNAIRVENHKFMFIGDIYKIENGEVIHLNEKKIF